MTAADTSVLVAGDAVRSAEAGDVVTRHGLTEAGSDRLERARITHGQSARRGQLPAGGRRPYPPALSVAQQSAGGDQDVRPAQIGVHFREVPAESRRLGGKGERVGYALAAQGGRVLLDQRSQRLRHQPGLAYPRWAGDHQSGRPDTLHRHGDVA